MTRDFDRLTLKDRRLTSRKKVVALSCIRWMGLLVGVTQYCWVANIVYFFLTSNCLQIQFFLSQCTNSVSLYKYKYLCIVWVLFSQFCINVLLDNTDIVVSIFFFEKKKKNGNLFFTLSETFLSFYWVIQHWERERDEHTNSNGQRTKQRRKCSRSLFLSSCCYYS